jgi:O-antigen ligase
MLLVGCLFAFYFTRQMPTWQRLILIMGVMSILYGATLLPIVSNRINYGISDIKAYIRDDGGDDIHLGSASIRIELWKTGWYIFLEHPVTGVGVGGFQLMAAENWERYQVHHDVVQLKYVHNQYLAALATRGVPGLILFLLFMTIPIYIAMQHKSEDASAEVARLSVIFICLVYLVGCLGEDHFETQPGIMFMSVFLALLLARISAGNRVIDNHLQTMAAPQG